MSTAARKRPPAPKRDPLDPVGRLAATLGAAVELLRGELPAINAVLEMPGADPESSELRAARVILSPIAKAAHDLIAANDRMVAQSLTALGVLYLTGETINAIVVAGLLIALAVVVDDAIGDSTNIAAPSVVTTTPPATTPWPSPNASARRDQKPEPSASSTSDGE